jgi:RNA polymerase sigma-70 factor (ECF subfamily)
VSELSQAGFAEFYRQTARSLWTYVYRVTGNGADADDIVQDAFCRVLRADIGGLSDEDRRRYLYRVASNLVADRWRRGERERSWAAERPAEPAAQQPDAALSATFSTLARRDRALLWLAYVEEHNHAEIADALGVKRASVKVLLSRARARLRDLLKTKVVI